MTTNIKDEFEKLRKRMDELEVLADEMAKKLRETSDLGSAKDVVNKLMVDYVTWKLKR